jgi:bacteriocin-like protein
MKNIFTEEVELTEEQLAEISGGCDGGCGFGESDDQGSSYHHSFNNNVSQQSENRGGLLGLGLLNNNNHLLF